jgi:hypothetical protein
MTNQLSDPLKDKNGFATVSVDSDLIDAMTSDIKVELLRNPARKKISYREMIATYREAYIREQELQDTAE